MIFTLPNLSAKISKRWKRMLTHSPYIGLIVLLIILFYYNGIFVILPSIVHNESHALIHKIIIHYLLFNVLGNLYKGMFTNTSIKKIILNPSDSNVIDGWTTCVSCETLAPPRSWHCSVCDVCILRRDHHCNFFACCIGLKNQRYFVMFLFHTSLILLYAFYFTVQFAMDKITLSSYITALKLFFPLAAVVIDGEEESIFILLLVVNFAVAAFVLVLLFLQIIHLNKGVTQYEANHGVTKYNLGWKSNWKLILGDKWYLTWLSPFIKSELTCDGLQFPSKKIV